MYTYLFGPVPSRRLGISLGVDLVPMKTCSLNCIYCECGPTTELSITRDEYIKPDSIKKELHHFFNNNPLPDFVTFSGSGEPTLNSCIGNILSFIKATVPNIPVAVLTNGTLLFSKNVRNEINNADLVLPSLDAATPEAFHKINRPHMDLDIENIIEGLVQFRKEYKGKIYLEVFIIPGINDTEKELFALKKAIKKISPDRVQLNTLDRPGILSTIRSSTHTELNEIVEFWDMDQVEIIAAAPTRKTTLSYRSDIESAILETIKRRPCTLEDLVKILALHTNEINKYLDVLEADKKIKVIHQPRGFFYQRT